MAVKNLTDNDFVQAAERKREGETYVSIGKAFSVSDKKAKAMVEKGIEILAKRSQESASNGSGAKRKDYGGEKVLSRVVQLREEEELGWKSIAQELDLGTPGTARRAYRNAKNLPRNAPLGRVGGRGGRIAWKKDYPEGAPVSESDRRKSQELKVQGEK